MLRQVLAFVYALIVTISACETAASEGANQLEDIILKAAEVVPSKRQLEWQKLEFACFVHFGINTFTGSEWGDGNEDTAIFNPSNLDPNQWVEACKDAGITELVFTAKHHDGFCLWPSKHTEHSVKNSPWKEGKGDLVREVADACRKGGIKFGFYLSPWDRHEPTYGDSPKYNEFFLKQLEELLTNYGPVAEVWFDGACGEGPNGKKQEYDFQSYYNLIRRLQPEAVISISGPDVRWCGNEAGTCRESEWSVVPSNFVYDAPDIASRTKLLETAKVNAELIWYPAQVDTSIRPGWFYHTEEDDKVRSLEELLEIYFNSVGGNAQLLLNIPPDKRGLFHENDVQRLREMGHFLRSTFSKNFASDASVKASTAAANHGPEKTLDNRPKTYWCTAPDAKLAVLEYDLKSEKTFDTLMLQENIATGQQIEKVYLDILKDGRWRQIAESGTVGFKRIIRFDKVTADKVRLRIPEFRGKATLSSFGLYKRPELQRYVQERTTK